MTRICGRFVAGPGSIDAENLLLYNEQAEDKAKVPLPMGPSHKFAPLALGDISRLVAHVVASTGPHGLGDKVRGQRIAMYDRFVSDPPTQYTLYPTALYN